MKNNNFNFRYISRYEYFDALKELVLKLGDEDWRYFKDRNTIASQNAYTMPIIYPPKSIFSEQSHRHTSMFSEHIKLIENQLGATVNRAILTRLPAGNSISRHKDTGDFLKKNNRVHLPITTNTFCTFTVGDEIEHIPEGEFWEINNTGKYHSVVNDGDFDRIHLIVDIA
jgi:hypothetical protein